ncbi:hypothetical protein [Chryseobacterium sp. JK1]|uniref:hypothetical protein n=1 Tax=Chryseobacterium sp. JK1 TaxID=874294 RepID=UPI003D68CCA9
MKWIVIFTVFFISLNAQKTRFDSVAIKFKKDSISYNQYIEFGKIYCLNNKSYTLEDEYGSKYNLLFPLPRLISSKVIKQQFANYNKNHKKKKCNCIYRSGSDLKKMYINLVENKKNYNIEPEYDVENYMKDYLENYYIRIQTE